MSKPKTITAADLFCGAGGTSEGLLMAANQLNADLSLVAVNHWNVAIDTHAINHPYAKHLCTGIDSVNPRELVPSGRLNVLCASPECTHHSVARGGRPMSDQSRSSAWHILRFAEALYIDNLVIENVPEFLSWGPLGANGRPMKSKRGHLFEQFIVSLRALGYNVEWRILNCADYGDPTTRRRLFVIARRGGKAVHWPEPTHIPRVEIAETGLFQERRKPWRTAREIIDWELPSKSIFERKKPLADKTLLRIQAGLKKFCGIDVDLKRCFAEDLRPFLVVLRGTASTASVDEPLNTVTANGNHYGLVEPFLAHYRGDHEGRSDGAQRNGSLSDPLPTQDTSNRYGLVEPFPVLLRKGQGARDLDEPLATLTTKGANYGIAEPFLAQWDQQSSDGGHRSIDEPVPTVVTKANTGIVEPFLIGHPRQKDGTNKTPVDSVDAPLRTVTATSCDMSVVEPFLVAAGGPEGKGRQPGDINAPMPSVITENHTALVEPFMVPHFGEREGQEPRTHSVDQPAPTVTSSVPLLVEPFIVPQGVRNPPREIERPLDTLTTTSRGVGLAEPFMMTVNHGEGNVTRCAQSVDEPMPTATSKIGTGICEPFIVAYYGTQNMSETGEPLPAITTKDRFGLVEAEVTHYRLDIRFRMLQPRELARAQGFPDTYQFTGNREEVVKQIGNAVPPHTAHALLMEVLA